MSELYHGSMRKGITELEPHRSTHGNYVYATKFKELAVIFAGRAGDDLTYSLFRNSDNEPWQLVERIPKGFDVMFNNEAAIYTLSDCSFKDIKTGFAEMVSEEKAKVIDEEDITNVYQELEKLNEAGLIKMYHYPERPMSIPRDDSDLIEKELRQAERNNRKVNRSTFERLLFLHPNLLEQVNKVGCLKSKDFIPFKKEELLDIFDKFLVRQIIYPEREKFLSSAVRSFSNTYPEFNKVIQEKIQVFDQTKEEKIKFVFETLTKDIKNIPKELIEEELNKCLTDERSFNEIGKDIYEVYRKVRMMEELVNSAIDEEVLKNSIILIGPMGSGKSTIGKVLYDKLALPRVSLDNREALSDLYQERKNFKNFKEFEFFLTGTILTNLDTPKIIDFGAGHSVYENPIMFLEMDNLIRRFKNVVLLIPSDDKEESLTILNQRKKIESASEREQDNRHFIYSPCNYELATITQYTKDKEPETITNEIINNIYGDEEVKKASGLKI